ncbi:MAG TPA: diguanylate cyclase [Solirubrobacteraceae bacterium]|nr:diguanylate cyclase [Solirubrobacteraceae bacterium]
MRTRATPQTLFLSCLLGGLGVLVLHMTVGLGGPGSDVAIDDYVYNALMFGAALAVIARGVRMRQQRAAWLAMGAGVLCWSLGELYFTLFLENSSGGGVTPADGLYLAMYPCMYLAVLLLVTGGVRRLRASMVLDGLIAGLAAATLGAAVLLPPVIDQASGSAGVLAVTLAYPIGDLLLLFFTIGALALTGWRPGRVWLLIAASMLAMAIADGVYLYQTATNTYVTNTWLESLWPAAAVLLAIAAWTPSRQRRGGRRRREDPRLVTVPAVSLLVALGVLAYGNVGPQLTAPALGLATATVLAVCVRLVVTVRENLAVLAGSRRLALTDSLTGLGNRRRLMEDLLLACEKAAAESPWTLVMYDLNGFKRYNDTFGHPAGDTLLARLSDKLATAVGSGGTAYRMGGDEFCVLFRCDATEGQELVASSVGALSENGSGFTVSAAHGEVLIPAEAGHPAAILQLADQRLYRRKDPTRDGSAAAQLRDVLLQAFHERRPELREHQRGVGALVLAVGRRMGLEGEDLDVLARAAELHDVGKIAIPDAILDKAGPLSAEEWQFMHRHTILGERILMAASALRPVARLVRSSHERFDGKGYPDGLQGEEIPLGARIIFVCDAYHAMISKRPYSAPLSMAEARAELRECAGTQFDPEVVGTFLATLAGDGAERGRQRLARGSEIGARGGGEQAVDLHDGGLHEQL